VADRLQQLLQARERLLHDVSHEFRSPLTRIRLAAELEHRNPERCASSLGNPDLLRKAIENVLRNAVRFSQSGQSVTLSLNCPTDTPGMLRIEISDQGPGVPSAALERIFEPFERLEQSSSSSGFGLGLAIARSAVRAHRGTIWAANRPGGGLIVTLQLPLERNPMHSGEVTDSASSRMI
jgi:two-component system OmpR family sensor kinase